MIIARPGGPDDDIPFRSVARPLLDVFRAQHIPIQVDVLRRPTFDRLRQVLADRPRDYPILHFDGHGTYADGVAPPPGPSGARGYLVFEDAVGDPDPITGEELGDLLRGTGLRLVILNACQWA